ncbi:uncharacterized protein LOC135688396 [Rhopilema esculentum]|uniref:uncharacterized protein LOC135688396 n=1 Tax=Rhopilema esculentum TaxID=499914 RepID=UPI0031E2066D|eukprot:gene7070-12709_t
MGAADSKDQIPTPETPQYLKYSHLKELGDPRSPVMDGGEPRTPILTVDQQKRMVDPRSPTYVVPRTPIFCIPEPELNAINNDSNDAKKLEENDPQEGDSEVREDTHVSPDLEAEPEKAKPNTLPVDVESSPEKISKTSEFSDKGYLISKSKSTAGAKKKRRRRKNRKPKDDENSGVNMLKSTKNFKEKSQEQVKRSPLVTRNFIPLEESGNPSLEKLITKTKKLSVGVKPRNLDFREVECMGQENLAAAFTP